MRSLKVERLYSLGDYKNIKFCDEVIDLPEKVQFNEPLLDKIRYLQLITVEKSMRTYKDLVRNIGTLKEEEILAYLDEQRENTLDEIKNLLQN
jgi:hypothetical protein